MLPSCRLATTWSYPSGVDTYRGRTLSASTDTLLYVARRDSSSDWNGRRQTSVATPESRLSPQLTLPEGTAFAIVTLIVLGTR